MGTKEGFATKCCANLQKPAYSLARATNLALNSVNSWAMGYPRLIRKKGWFVQKLIGNRWKHQDNQVHPVLGYLNGSRSVQTSLSVVIST